MNLISCRDTARVFLVYVHALYLRTQRIFRGQKHALCIRRRAVVVLFAFWLAAQCAAMWCTHVFRVVSAAAASDVLRYLPPIRRRCASVRSICWFDAEIGEIYAGGKAHTHTNTCFLPSARVVRVIVIWGEAGVMTSE